jgi:DNA-directed RNA polymerase subunit N (RpoN/RPB10)
MRCKTCGKLLGDKFYHLVIESEKIKNLNEEIRKKKIQIIKQKLPLKRYCCKQSFIEVFEHTEIII